MPAFSLPCPSCHTVLTFAAPPAADKSFRCPKCQTIFHPPSSDAKPPEPPAKQPAVRAGTVKSAAARKPAAAPENAFSFVEEERIEEAAAPPRKKGGGFLIVALLGFVILLLGVGGGGFAVLYFTGALSAKPAAPAAPANRALLLGRWELKGVTPTLFTEFRDDGTLVNGGGGSEMKGTWKLVDEATLQVALDVPGKPPLQRLLKIQASKDQLTLTDEQNQVDVYQRPTP